MREQTAEIASWALSDAGSVRSDSSPRRRYASAISSAGATDEDLSIAGGSERDEAIPRESHESTRPGPIEEVPEPVSPNSTQSSQQSPGASVLAQLIRDSPPQEIERVGAEGTDDVVSESPPTMTVTDVDTTSSNEQSTLLRKNTPYTSHTTHHYGTTQDLEGQTHGGEVSYRHWPRTAARHALRIVKTPKSWTLKGLWEHGCVRPTRYVPAVILGLLLNILDALSYG